MANDNQGNKQSRPGRRQKLKAEPPANCPPQEAEARALIDEQHECIPEQVATPAQNVAAKKKAASKKKRSPTPEAEPTPEDPFYGLFQASFAEASEKRPATLRDYFGGMPPRAWLEKYNDPANPHDPYHELRDEFRLVLKAYPACLAPMLRPSSGLNQQLDNDGDLGALEAVQRLALEVLREFAEQPDFATLARETQQRVLGAAEALARELGEAPEQAPPQGATGEHSRPLAGSQQNRKPARQSGSRTNMKWNFETNTYQSERQKGLYDGRGQLDRFIDEVLIEKEKRRYTPENRKKLKAILAKVCIEK